MSKLWDFLDYISYGFTNPMSDSDEWPRKITAKDVVNWDICFETARHTTQSEYDKLTDKSKPRKWDVLLTKDWTLWRLAVVNSENICINQSVAVLRPNEKINSDFLKYLLSTNYYQKMMIGDASGSTIKHIYVTRVDKMEVSIPDLNEQKKIVNVLKNIDSKIKNNNKINSELESMAKELYEYRFVQFDFPDGNWNPYKSSGWKMVWNDELKREIPEWWEVKTLGDSCEIYQPGILSAKDCIEDGEYFVHGSNWIIGKYNDYNHENSEIIVSCRWDCWNIHRTLPKMWITWNAMVIRLKDKSIHNEYLYQSLFYAWIKNISTGSVQWQITRANISPLKIIIPSKNIIDKFNKMVIPTVDEKLKNLLENQKLSELRDFLLPMLMNGQVVVK